MAPNLHLITRILNHRTHYWNTCGWSRYLRTARRFTLAEANRTLQQMSDDGLLRIAIL